MLALLLGCAGGAEPAAPTPAVQPASAISSFELPSGPGAITPSFTPRGDDLLYVWQEPGPAEGGAERWRVRFSRRHGAAWSPPVDIVSGTGILANWADYPSVGAAADGTLVAHWFRETKDAYDFAMRRSTDGGNTWVDLPAPYPAGLAGERGFLSYVAEGDGLRVFWLDGRDVTGGHHAAHGGATALRSARLGAAGFGVEEVVDPRTCDCCATDAVLAGGQAVVVYRDRDDGERRDIGAARAPGGGSWASGTPVGGDGWLIQGCPVNGPAADAGGDRAVTAWFTGAGDRQTVRVAFSDDEGATFTSAATVVDAATDARPLGRVDTLLDADGTALVSWLSAEGEQGRVRMRRVAPDGRVGPSVDLGAVSTSRSAGFPRLARVDGKVVAAWTEPDRGNVAVTFDSAYVPAVAEVFREAGRSAATPTLPEFTATDLHGKPVSNVGLRGKPVLLNVWATWCGPCREELPVLEVFQRDHPEVQVLALSVDGAGANDAVRTMADARAPALTVLHPDAGGLAGKLGVSALPRTFLYDGDGALVWSSEGAVSAGDPGLAAALERVSMR